MYRDSSAIREKKNKNKQMKWTKRGEEEEEKHRNTTNQRPKAVNWKQFK